jgi:hypothetical protein
MAPSPQEASGRGDLPGAKKKRGTAANDGSPYAAAQAALLPRTAGSASASSQVGVGKRALSSPDLRAAS